MEKDKKVKLVKRGDTRQRPIFIRNIRELINTTFLKNKYYVINGTYNFARAPVGAFPKKINGHIRVISATFLNIENEFPIIFADHTLEKKEPENDPDKVFTCPRCGKEYKRESSLEKHLLRCDVVPQEDENEKEDEKEDVVVVDVVATADTNPPIEKEEV